MGLLFYYWYCYADKKWNTDFFQITCFKERKNMAVKETSRLWLEASSNHNIHTGERFLCSCYFWKFRSRFLSDRVKLMKSSIKGEMLRCSYCLSANIVLSACKNRCCYIWIYYDKLFSRYNQKKKKKKVSVKVNINKLYDPMHLWKKSIHILLQHSKNRVVASAVFLKRNKLFLR